MNTLICPVSHEKVSEHLPRVNAFVVIVLVGLYISMQMVVIPFILTADFLLRGFNHHKYSPTFHLSVFISKQLRLDSKKIDKAPKLFAARLGAIMFLFGTLFHLIGFVELSIAISIIVSVLALLECVFSVCVGCIIFSYLVLPAIKKENI